MGIKNLSDLLKKCNFDHVHLGKYKYKKLAIDISPFLFKYKIIFQDRWLHSFVNLVCCLRRNNVHAVFIYDGKAPIEKQAEKDHRRQKRDEIRDKGIALKKAVSNYEKTGEIDPILMKVKKVRFLDEGIDKQSILELAEKYSNQSTSITFEDRTATRELLDKLGVPWLRAPGEAEKYACELFKAGLVSAVVSDDTDVLAYGATMLCKLDTKTETVMEIRQDDLLNQLDLKRESFRHLTVMLGTDFNKNIRGIGPAKAYKLIKQYGTIDEISKKNNLDVSCLNHKRVLEIFTLGDISNEVVIPFCSKPDLRDLSEYNINLISNDMCQPNNIVFD